MYHAAGDGRNTWVAKGGLCPKTTCHSLLQENCRRSAAGPPPTTSWLFAAPGRENSLDARRRRSGVDGRSGHRGSLCETISWKGSYDVQYVVHIYSKTTAPECAARSGDAAARTRGRFACSTGTGVATRATPACGHGRGSEGGLGAALEPLYDFL